MSYTLYDDDLLIDIQTPKPVHARISNLDLCQSKGLPVTVSYANMDYGRTAYGFNQEFSEKDARRYFKLMRKFCSNTLEFMESLNDEPDDEGEKLHLYNNPISGNLKKVLETYDKEAAQAIPYIYHFALYTCGNASRKTKVRSPRVYFMVGAYGIIYPLFFDPFHEINPTDY